jgi:hypothetical protein
MYGRYLRGIRCPFPMRRDIFPAQVCERGTGVIVLIER